MDVRIKFLGGVKSVTGSKFLLEVDDKKFLVDCGLFQGKKELRLRNWYPLPVEPKSIDYVILTHTHIDHTGFLPRFIKDGYPGKIICTSATEDLMKIMLPDAGKLQEEEAAFAFRHGYSKHSKPLPLFTLEDAKRALEFVEAHPFQKEIYLSENVSIVFHNAGHILGAAIVEIILRGKTQTKRIVFSGDLGRNQDPLMFPPFKVKEADILLVESTYGDRINQMDKIETELAGIVNEACQQGGCLIIPAFAVGRTQNLVYYLHQLIRTNKIPSLPIYVDSPMAIGVSSLYEKHSDLIKLSVKKEGSDLISIFDSPFIHFCNTPESSAVLNDLKTSAIIISAGGVCTGGRILHHLYHRLPKSNDTILFAGYQAEGTRGRDILEGRESIRIFGIDVPVRCHVKEIQGLSAHADQGELMEWLGNFQRSPKMTFITHGELPASQMLAEKIRSNFSWNCFIPEYLESFEVFNGI